MILNFQTPASEFAHALIMFHHHIFFFLIIILCIIIWLLKCMLLFKISNISLLENTKVINYEILIFKWIKFFYIKYIKHYLELIFKPSVFLYDNVDVYKYRWLKIAWYWIYVLTELFIKKVIIKNSIKLIDFLIINSLKFKFTKFIIYFIYNIYYVINKIVFSAFKKNPFDTYIVDDFNKFLFIETKYNYLTYNFIEKFKNLRTNFTNKALFYTKKNRFFSQNLFDHCRHFYLSNKEKVYFDELELSFYSKFVLTDFISFIEFCHHLNDNTYKQFFKNNDKINFFFLEKKINVSKFKREVFKTDKIFSFSRSVFFNNWIEVVFEKEHITEDDSDLLFYNGVYFSNLCLQSFKFFKNNYLISNSNSFKLKPIYKSVFFRNKTLWTNFFKKVHCTLFKFFINVYIYNKFYSDIYLQCFFKKPLNANYIRIKNFLHVGPIKPNVRFCNSSFFTKFFLLDLNFSSYLFFQNFKHSLTLEWIWTVIPVGILMMILYPSLLLLYHFDKPYVTRPYVTIKVIGNQWYWSYEYSDNAILMDYESKLITFYEGGRRKVKYVVVPSNDESDLIYKDTLPIIKFDSYMLTEEDLNFGQLRLLEVDRRVILPVGVCIRIVTTATDVIHSWAVPALGVKIDSVPGRLNQFWLVISKPGIFYGQCSELCGVNHGFMPIAVEGISLDQYYDYLYNFYKKN